MTIDQNSTFITDPLDGLRTELEEHIDRPPAGDIYLKAFAIAARGLLETTPEVEQKLRALLSDYQKRERVPSSTEIIAKTQRMVQKRLLAHLAIGQIASYPAGFEAPEAWIGPISNMLSIGDNDSRKEFDAYSYEMVYLAHMGNVMGRYQTLLPIVNLLRERFGETPKLLDGGAARMIGPKKILDRSEFDPIVALGNTSASSGLPDPDASDVVQRLFLPINQDVQIDGMDIWPLRDELIRLHARSCSFYPQEFLNVAAVAEYDRLDSAEFSALGFIQGNLAHPRVHQDLVDQYHGVFLSTMLYQNTNTDIQNIISNAKSYLHPAGILVVQDFVGIDPSDTNKLLFPDHWFEDPFPYRTLIYDMAQPNEGFQELFLWTNGRCRMLKLGSKAFELFSETS